MAIFSSLRFDRFTQAPKIVSMLAVLTFVPIVSLSDETRTRNSDYIDSQHVRCRRHETSFNLRTDLKSKRSFGGPLKQRRRTFTAGFQPEKHALEARATCPSTGGYTWVESTDSGGCVMTGRCDRPTGLERTGIVRLWDEIGGVVGWRRH